MAMKQQERLHEGDYEALANLRYRIRRFRQFSAKEAQRLGLTPQQHQALLAIKGQPAGKKMSTRMLAERLLMDRNLADGLVQELVGKAYIETDPAAAGPGKQFIRLTNKAEGVLDRLASAHLFEIRKMAPELMQALRVLQDRQNMQRIAWMQ
ncbi:helix-turn-helix domain-containing protein [Rhizobium sp. CIAT894]|uniref:helix-turn-helix domain-containing protein n=1 Tax=Rhizobium sp. CIAT894 TaxID=2020312 RepID=UPI0032AFE1D9